MQPRLEATLADFVPALRFLSPDRVHRRLGHPDLPPAWWTSVPISRAVDAIGATELPNRLAELAYGELRHLRLGDLLPAAWLARNDFRLSQWPSGVRTNVLVRTPDWADLLGSTVQEIGDWTNGTTTVRPVISQLFAEVLGLLPADQATGEVAAVAAPEDADAADVIDAADATTESTQGAEPEADDEAEPVVPAPRGIRISKRPPVTPAPETPDDSPGSGDEVAAASDAPTEDAPEEAAYDGEYGDLVDAIEDELRPVSIPAPPTGDLSAVVCWLAEEAPDVPLMSELTRVTLEIVAVVGVENAPQEVRTSLLRLMSLVPASLLPEGLDTAAVAADTPSEDSGEPAPDLEDPYDAPEMTSVLGAAPPSPPDDATVLARPETPPPPPWAADAEDLTVLAMPAAAAPPGDSPVPAAEPDDAVDAFGEVPPMTRDDIPAQPVPPAPVPAPAEDDGSVDAFGEIPPATRDDFPVPATPPATELRKAPTQKAHEPGNPVASKSAAEPGPESPAAQGLVIPPKPSGPPPLPPRPSNAPPAAEAPARAREAAETFVDEPPAAAPDDTDDTGSAPAPGNIVMVLAAWFTGREPRWRTLARERLFTDSPRDTASLATEFDKDAVEVEALERALRQHLAHQLEQPGGAAVRAHLDSVETRLGPVATVAELRDLDKRHTATIPGLGVQLWQVVRGLLALNTSVDGWLTAGAPGELESRTAEIVGAACARSGSVPFTALEPPLSALGIRPEVREAWIARLDGFDLEDGVVHPWPADESGPVPAAAPAPETVVIKPEDVPVPAAAASGPGDAARCFRDDQGVWWYRVDVEAPFLEGERLPLPPQFVQALGLRPDGSLRLHHAAGPAALRWDHEPYCVSLRAILHGLGAEIGDMVFIGSVRPGRLETRLLAGDGKLRLPRWARALRHTGVDPVPDQVNLPALLGARLGLEDGCDLKAVLKRLQDRGDADVLELLGVAPAH